VPAEISPVRGCVKPSRYAGGFTFRDGVGGWYSIGRNILMRLGMSKFKVGDCVIVREGLEIIPKEWEGKKGKIIAVSVVKSTVGFRSIGQRLSESGADVFLAHYVLFDGETRGVPIDESWLKLC
jgi:hypothetical protein